ncbi:hypothetical protein VZT92_025054 [Zoarces viviparus]|uniref:Uncharacterized protein n=1 Tax=Zoarces viviparus TaxID=48416 RepID=A0AAW1E3X8_ZOAVI
MKDNHIIEQREVHADESLHSSAPAALPSIPSRKLINTHRHNPMLHSNLLVSTSQRSVKLRFPVHVLDSPSALGFIFIFVSAFSSQSFT